jgi:hexosaminidase
MKKGIVLLQVILLCLKLNAQTIVHIIPEPKEMLSNGKIISFNINKLSVDATTETEKNIVDIITNKLSIIGLNPPPDGPITGRRTYSHYLIITENKLPIKNIKDSLGYTIDIDSNTIKITGSSIGLFYGAQTLFQILEQYNTHPNGIIKLPQIHIADYPTFLYRGMHLDVSRHFFNINEVERYIDYLARYKFNVFHWHLTDDQGWRIEIKKYPLLTKIGSTRSGTIFGKYPGTGNDKKEHKGYYTQKEIKEVIAYATKNNITIIPEIEMPAHSCAALAAYPYLGCTGGPYKVEQTWGGFDDVFCAGNDSTFDFLENVLDEVANLFPSKYIHIGGDECVKKSWKACLKCQSRIRNNKLKNENELQSYFIQRIEQYLNQKGKQIIGWDEILEGGIAPNATIMSWRGEDGGIAAANQKHFAIMTPGSHCYFDHSQIKPDDSLTIGGFTSVKKVFMYNPIPNKLTTNTNFIYGTQANVWTEYITNFKKVEYQIFPRMLALSEVAWGKNESNNNTWPYFYKKIKTEFKYLDENNINHLPFSKIEK